MLSAFLPRRKGYYLSPKLNDKSIDQRRAVIFEAAAKCFGEKGYYMTSVDNIVEEAGISKGALYTYYPSKDSIFHLLLEKQVTELFEQWDQACAAMTSATQKMHSFFEYQRRACNDISLSLEYWLYSQNSEEARAFNIKRYRNLTNYLARIIQEGQAGGEFSSEVDPARISAITWAFLDGIKVRYIVLKDDADFLADIAWMEHNTMTMLKPSKLSSGKKEDEL